MRNWFIIFLFLVACKPEKIGIQENVSIYGLWETGRKPEIIAVLLNGDAQSAVTSQLFELTFPDGETASFNFTGENYVLASERTPQPGETLRLLWIRQNDTATVSVEMPPELSNVMVSTDTLQSTGDDECTVEWVNPGGGYEFALRLECVDQVPQPLPWTPGNFMQLYNGPQVATQLTLQPASFAYYGTNELAISVLNTELRDAFFFDLSDIRGLLKQGPDNVSGAKGFVTGVSTKRILLEIE